MIDFYFVFASCTYWFLLGFCIGSAGGISILRLLALSLLWPVTFCAAAYRYFRPRKEEA